jgi:hypothetical protein
MPRLGNRSRRELCIFGSRPVNQWLTLFRPGTEGRAVHKHRSPCCLGRPIPRRGMTSHPKFDSEPRIGQGFATNGAAPLWRESTIDSLPGDLHGFCESLHESFLSGIERSVRSDVPAAPFVSNRAETASCPWGTCMGTVSAPSHEKGMVERTRIPVAASTCSARGHGITHPATRTAIRHPRRNDGQPTRPHFPHMIDRGCPS